MALVKYPKGFDAKISYQLRERDYNTLEDMQKGAVSVEANLIEKRARMRSEKKVTYRNDTSASTYDPKYDSLAKTMERLGKLVENLTIQVSNQNRNQNHNENQNFRRNNPPNR